MTTTNKHFTFNKDLANKKVIVIREFDAPVEQVWKAWTDSSLLDLWWAPKPWKAVTKSMDFRVGGFWLYFMEGPDGARHYARVDYKSIELQKSFSGVDSFCDEDGTVTDQFPNMSWHNVFKPTSTGTTVEIEITFSSEENLAKIMEMGFEQGFTAALGNLDEVLAQ